MTAPDLVEVRVLAADLVDEPVDLDDLVDVPVDLADLVGDAGMQAPQMDET